MSDNWTGTNGTLSGNWNTATEWSAGVPAAGSVALFHIGNGASYTVSGNGTAGDIENYDTVTLTGTFTAAGNGPDAYNGYAVNVEVDGGTLTVAPGAAIENSQAVAVGYQGRGALVINGQVSDTDGLIGYGGSFGTVTVSGQGAGWTNSSLLTIANSSTAALTIANGGSVGGNDIYLNQYGTIALDDTATLTGTIDLGTGLVEAIPAAAQAGPATVTLANALTLAGVTGTLEGTGTTLLGAASTVADYGATTLDVTGLISGSGYGGLVTEGSVKLSDGANAYAGFTTIDSGALELAAPGAAGSGDIVFAGSADATLKLDGTVLPANTIDGFTTGDTIDLANLTVTSTSYVNNVLTLYDAANAVGTLNVSGSYPGDVFIPIADGAGGTEIAFGLSWAEPQSGDIDTVSDWTPQAAPSAAYDLVFATGSATPYAVSGNASPEGVVVAGDQVTIAGTLTPTGTAADVLDVDDGGQLTVTGEIEAPLGSAEIGAAGTGTLLLDGQLFDSAGTLGAGTVSVSGSLGDWGNERELVLGGNSGPALLQILDQATVISSITGTAADFPGLLLLSNGTAALDDTATLSGPILFDGGALDAINPPGTASSAGVVIANSISFGALPGTLEAAAGTALTLDGTISGSGAIVTEGSVVLDDSAADYTGSGATIAAGTLELAKPAALGGGSITFAAQADATLKLDGGTLPSGTIAGFAPGEVIDLANLAATSASLNDGVLTIDNGNTTVGTLALGGNVLDAFVVTPDGFGGSDIREGAAWAQAQSGSFATASNWIGAAVPGSAELALFDTGSATPYTISGDGAPGAIAVEGDQVTFTGSIATAGFVFASPTVDDVAIGGGGQMTIAAGAILAGAVGNGGSVNLGEDGSGTLDVAGLLTAVSVLTVGESGAGALSITDGGEVSDGLGFVGAGGTGSATVSGPGSDWINSSYLTAGGTAAGLLSIEDGGAVANGAGGLTLLGGGTLALDDTGTLAGGIYLYGGTIQAIDQPGSTASPAVTLDNAISLLNGVTNTVEAAAGTALVLGGAIANAGGAITVGAGDVALADAANSYTGGTTIDTARLELAAAGAAGTGPIAFAAGDGGTLLLDAGVGTLGNALALNGGAGTVDVAAGATVTLGGAISGAGSLATGGGTLVLAAAANSYAGGTTLDSGTLVVAAAGDAGNGAISFAQNAGATLKLDGTALPANTIEGFAGGDIIDLAGIVATSATWSGGTLSIDNGTTLVGTLALAGAYGSTNFAVAADGAGGSDITLGFAWANAQNGAFDAASNWLPPVAPGTADVAYFETGSSTPYTVSGSGTPAEVVVQGDQVTITGSIAPVGTLALNVDGGGALTVGSGGTFSDPAGNIEVGLGGAGTLSDDGSVSAAALLAGSNAAGSTGSGIITVSGPAASLSAAQDVDVENASTLDISAGGTVTTSNANAGLFTAGNIVTVSGPGSTLNVTGGAGLNVFGGEIAVTHGGTLLAAAGGIGVGYGHPGAGTLALDDTAQVSGALFPNEGTLMALDAVGQSEPGTATLSGAVDLSFSGSDVLAATALTALAIGGDISGGAGLDVSGGTVRLDGADDTYSGGTTLFAGTLDLANPAGAGTGTLAFDAPGGTALPGQPIQNYAANGTLRVESGGTLHNAIVLGSEVITTVGSVASETATGATGTIETAAGAAVTLAGSIADLDTAPGTLVTDGDVVLADAANSYSGGTTIEAGTLELAAPGAAGTGAISFAPHAGATLKLDGTVLPGNAIAGFAPGDTLDLTGETVTSTELHGGTLTLLDNGASIGTLLVDEQTLDSPFVAAPDGAGGTDLVAGFAWTAPAGGDFATADDWTPAGPPGTADTAFFDTGAAQPYTVSGDGTPGDIEVDGDQVILTGSLAPQGIAPVEVGNTTVVPVLQIDQGGALTIGAGATISAATVLGNVLVGGDGTGTLTIQGLVDTANSNAEIGSTDGGIAPGAGVAVVAGAGASWSLSELDVGAEVLGGTGSLTIAGGGQVSDQRGVIGLSDGGSVTVTGPGSGWVNQSLTLERSDADLTIAAGGSVAAGTLELGASAGGTVALDDTATLTGGIGIAEGTIQAIDAPGQSSTATVTLDNAITLSSAGSFEGTGHAALDLAGGIGGGGTLSAAGGDVILAGADSYSGGSTIAAGSLDLAAAGAAGSGGIVFAASAAGTLRIDGAVDLPAGTISGFAGGDLIDLPFLAYAPGATTATVDAGTLTVSNGTGSATLTLAGIASGTTLVATGDGSGGTEITGLTAPAPVVAAGGTAVDGTATDSTASDQITVYGPLNTIDTFGGNEIITGGSMAATGVDDATWINLGTTAGVTPASNAGVLDAIDINGGNNTLSSDGTLVDEAKSAAAGHTVTAQVADFTDAMVSYVIGGQGSTIGGDYGGIDNVGGTNVVSIDGPSDVLYVNDDATNLVTTGPTAGYTYLYLGSPLIGSAENLGAGYASTITLGGNGNYVFGSEANHDIMIGGTADGTVYGNNDDVTFGNGNNTIAVTGIANQIIVGSGNNVIDAGAGNALVAPEFFGESATAGTDTVTLGGGYNQVYAPETANLTVTGGPLGGNAVDPFIGGGATYVADGNDNITLGGGSNLVSLGNGNDTVTLAGTIGGNAVSLGDGNDSVSVAGASNVIGLGGGNDTLSLGGDSDRTTFSGAGTETVQMNASTGSILQLGSGDAEVSGTGTNNTISASDTAGASVVLNLGSATGDVIGLGSGSDTIVSAASNTAITVGGGNDTITDDADAVSITAGNGNDTIGANGSFDTITLGSGNNTLTATGVSDTITVAGGPASSNDLTLGDNASGTVAGGVDTITFGTADTFDLLGLGASSTLMLGSSDMAFLGSDADANVSFGGAGSTLVINGSATYTGQVALTDFGSLNTLDLVGLVGANGEQITGLQQFTDNLQTIGGNTALMLSGGGHVAFAAPVNGGFTAADVRFG